MSTDDVVRRFINGEIPYRPEVRAAARAERAKRATSTTSRGIPDGGGRVDKGADPMLRKGTKNNLSCAVAGCISISGRDGACRKHSSMKRRTGVTDGAALVRTLTEAQVAEARKLRANFCSVGQIAKRLGATPGAVKRALNL